MFKRTCIPRRFPILSLSPPIARPPTHPPTVAYNFPLLIRHYSSKRGNKSKLSNTESSDSTHAIPSTMDDTKELEVSEFDQSNVAKEMDGVVTGLQLALGKLRVGRANPGRKLKLSF